MGVSTEQKSVRQSLNISRLAIHFPRFTIGFWIAVALAGIVAFGSLRYALFPDITFPVIVVNATSQTATSSGETEAGITIPIEAKLKHLADLDDILSTTVPGKASIRVSFQVGKNLEAARKATEDALKNVDVKAHTDIDIVSLNLNESSAVTYVIQSGQTGEDNLMKLTEKKIARPIGAVDGVAKVRVLGMLQGQPATRDSRHLELATPTQVRFNGKSALALEVIKTGNANTLDVVNRLERTMNKIRSGLPELQITQASTQANYIREASDATLEAIAIAMALSAIVIYPFLWNWKATLISALAIPTSILGTFIVMAISGFNLETITLLAIALVVGIIIDDAIVDVENISRHLDLGEPPRQAAISATNEIGLTVTAATLTIVAVFLPVGLMGGVVGQFFRPFGLTVSAAVLISLLVARTLSPLLSVYWLRKSPKRAENSRLEKLLSHYDSLLRWSLRHRYLVVSATLFSLLLGLGLVLVVPKGFIPRLDRGEFLVRFSSQQIIQPESIQQSSGPSAEPTNPLVQLLLQTKKDAIRIEKIVRETPDTSDILTTVGSPWGQLDTGELLIKLKKNRSLSTMEVQKVIREKLEKLSDIKISVEDIPFVDTGSEQPIQIKLHGTDLATLDQTARHIKDQLATLPGLVDIATTANLQPQQSVDLIEHENGKRVRYVTANLNPNISVDQAVALIHKNTNRFLPAGVTMSLGGDSERIGEILRSFAFTMILGVLSIIVVLCLLFRSWTDPLIIAFSLPLSLVGAMIALLLTGHEFGMISVIGVIFLMGLTNKNAIIMVDYINQLRQNGFSQHAAILEGASVRLRPILMTTAATILGMLPVALGLGAGSELRAPMAIAIMGGLMASSILSLLVIPVMYSLLEGFRWKMSRSM